MSDLLEDTRLEQTEIYSEMKKSYIDYAMSVIVGRALPDVRDGRRPESQSRSHVPARP